MLQEENISEGLIGRKSTGRKRRCNNDAGTDLEEV